MGIECIAYFLSVCTCATCVAGALRGQKRELDPLGLELWMVMSCGVGDGNGTRILC